MQDLGIEVKQVPLKKILFSEDFEKKKLEEFLFYENLFYFFFQFFFSVNFFTKSIG